MMPSLLQAIFQHLQLSMSALLLASLLAIGLALILQPFKRVVAVILQITGIMQTIPSLALLGLFIPFMGIGFTPSLIALIIYGIFPILQNTLVGLANVDPSLDEAARAFGMTRWERLKKLSLPLAMPMILSGIRTSAIMIIGTATLAALIGAGGLGTYILLGIDRQDNQLILIGALASAGLAILFSFLLQWLQRLKLKQVGITFVSLIAITGLTFVPFFLQTQTNNTIVIAGKLGAEPNILIHMYKLLIEDQSDLHVELKENLGKTSFLYQALKKGSIDLYPEFTGTITSTLLKQTPTTSTDPKTVYQQAKKGIYRQDHLVYLQPMAYQNTYALAVPKNYAKQHQLKKISDLKKVENQAIAGFTLEFNQRKDGNLGLQEKYQLSLQVKTMEPALRYKALEQGSIQIADVYSTDSGIKRYNLVLLKDDLQLFPPYQGAPLIRETTLKKYPELKKILNQLAGKITEEQMQQMNYQVDVLKNSPEMVAKEFLEKNHLLTS